MTNKVVYSRKGLLAVLLDNEAVALYLEGNHRIEITLSEWRHINLTLEVVTCA